MATLGQHTGYRSLAGSAAARLGSSSPSIVAAILAQWQCEQPAGPPWPPVHNNPGFVTIGALRSVNIVEGSPARSSPGVNFLAAFRSADEGAMAYAELLRRGGRYAGVRQAVARGDGSAFLQAVTAAGYGTRYSCAASAYRALGGSAAVSASTPATSTAASAACSFDFSFMDGRIVTAADVDRIVNGLRSQGCFSYLGANPLGPSGAEGEVRQIFATAIGRRWDKPLQLEIQSKLAAAAAAAGDPFGPVLGGIGEAIGGALGEATFTLIVGGTIAALFLMGIRRLAQ